MALVGTRLTRRLIDSGHKVQLLDIAESEQFPEHWRRCDVRNPRGSSVRYSAGADTIINLAAEHRDDVRPLSLYDEVNVHGAENVCRAAEELGIARIVFTSSVAIYGFRKCRSTRAPPCRYFNDYGRTKWEARRGVRRWLRRDASKRSLVIVRPTVIFGERNRGNVTTSSPNSHAGPPVMIGGTAGTGVPDPPLCETSPRFSNSVYATHPGNRSTTNTTARIST